MFNKTFTFLLLIGIVIDQLSKYFAESFLSFNEAKNIISPILSFQLVHNFGAAYGILQHHRIFLLSIGFIVLAISITFRHKIGTTFFSKTGLIFILIGASGNLIDRLFRGYVIDFIDIHIVPVFNVADVAIDIGIVLFFLDLFKKNDKIAPTNTSD